MILSNRLLSKANSSSYFTTVGPFNRYHKPGEIPSRHVFGLSNSDLVYLFPLDRMLPVYLKKLKSNYNMIETDISNTNYQIISDHYHHILFSKLHYIYITINLFFQNYFIQLIGVSNLHIAPSLGSCS